MKTVEEYEYMASSNNPDGALTMGRILQIALEDMREECAKKIEYYEHGSPKYLAGQIRSIEIK